MRSQLPALLLAAFCADHLAPSVAAAAEWRALGPDGGNVTAIAVETAPAETIHVATTSGRLFQSTDGGATWLARHPAPITGSRALAAVPGMPGVLLVGAYGALLRSTDGGTTFDDVSGAAAHGAFITVTQLETDPSLPGRVWASGLFGDARAPLSSTDGGATWAAGVVADGAALGGPLAVDRLRPGTLYAGSVTVGLYRSTDAGAAWGRVSDGPPGGEWGVLTTSSRTEGTLWSATLGAPAAISRSTDGGMSWAPESQFLPDVLALEEDPDTGALLLGSSGGLLRKSRGDAGFSPSARGFGGPSRRALEVSTFAFAPGRVFAGSSSGFAVSADGGASWSVRDRGLHAVSVTALASAGVRIYAAGDVGTASRSGYSRGAGTIFESDDAGAGWRPLAIPDANGAFTAVALARDGTVFAGTGGIGLFNQLGEIWRSDDGGARWRLAASGRTRIRTIVFDPRELSRIWALGTFSDGETFFSELFASTDSGRSFALVTNVPRELGEVALAQRGGRSVVVLVTRLGLLRSTDAGASWSAASRGPEGAYRLFADPVREGTLYAAGAGLWKSTDAGDTWTLSSAGLPRASTGSFGLVDAITSDGAGNLFAAVGSVTSGAEGNTVYRSPDAAGSWAPLPPPLPGGLAASALAVAGGALVAGTRSGALRHDDALSVASVTPASGSSAGGTILLVRGSGFTADTIVTVGGAPTTDFLLFDSGTIRVRTGAHPRGLADVEVRQPEGERAALANAFTYQDWTCDPSESTLCLEAGRFAIQVSFGEGQAAHAVPLTIKSGLFWFTFQPSPEVVVKVLDGRAQNGHYWVHLAGLTELAYEVRVLDTVTGAARTYAHASGAPQSVLDKESF